jgi:hypothetical protein
MTTSLTPALALDFITALSADVRAAVVVRRRGRAPGRPRASSRRPRARSREATRVAKRARAATGKVFVARDDRHTIVVVTGPFALPSVAHHDLGTALSALGGQKAPIGPPGRLEAHLVSALLSAV